MRDGGNIQGSEVVAYVRKCARRPWVWANEIGSIGTSCSEARGARNAELGIRPNSVRSILPEGCIIIDGLRCIEDSTIRGFVRELQRNRVVSSDLVSQIDVCKGNEDIDCSRTIWEEILLGRVLNLEELLRKVDVGVEDIEGVVRGSAAAAWCLHWAGGRETAGCDDADASFVVHHFHEECTGRITDSIGKLISIRNV